MIRDAPAGRGWRARLIVEERTRTRGQRRALLALACVLVVVGVAAFVALLVAVMGAGLGPLPVDRAVDDWMDERRSGELTRSFSFPSGHVLGMSDFLLLAAFLLASRIGSRAFSIGATACAILLVVAQAASRLYLGYHWLSDVGASVALSLVVVGTVVAIDAHRTVRIAGERIEGALSAPQRDGT